LIRDQQIQDEDKATLKEIQDRLFTVGALLASDPEKSRMKVPDLNDEDISLLEQEMDRMDEVLPALKHFVLPGGNTTASYCHVARCVCRRAERMVVHLNEDEYVNENVIIYLNRLSDYLFTLSRKVVFDNNGEENKWFPRV
jgi:cob(I)alamin adenosyltransferase